MHRLASISPGTASLDSMAREAHRSGGIAPSISWLDLVHLDKAFVKEWCELETNTSAPNPFYECWNLWPAIENLAENDEPKILAYREAGVLKGLLPVARTKDYYGRRIPHWTSWLHDNGFYGCPLVHRGCERGFWAALFADLDRKSGMELFLHLPKMAEESPVTRALLQELNRRKRLAAIVCREERAFLASALGSARYFETAITPKKRKELRRQVKRLGELGELKVERTSDGEGLDGWLDDFIALEHAGWKGEEGSSLASHAANERYFRAALRGGVAVHRIERLSLTLDARPIAMLVTFLSPPGSFSFKTAYDESLSKFSPGVLLQRENLGLLDRSDIAWCDSCAEANHPMIDHIWREKRALFGVNIALGGPIRRTAFRLMSLLERGAEPCPGGDDG